MMLYGYGLTGINLPFSILRTHGLCPRASTLGPAERPADASTRETGGRHRHEHGCLVSGPLQTHHNYYWTGTC